MIKSVSINDNITLNYIPMTKLKTTTIGIYIARKLDREEASKNALLPHVLKSGCKMCKNREEIAHFLENLYGAKMSAGISKKGDTHILCFEGETISDRFAPNGEKLTLGLLKLLLSVIFDTKDEFDSGDFLAERNNSITKIESVINDKRIYANYRCQEEMAKGDIFSVPRLGYKEDMKNITKEELHSYYKDIITSSHIDIYLCGDTDIEEIEREIKGFAKKFSFKMAEIPKSNILSPKDGVNVVCERFNVTQGKLSMGFLTHTKATDNTIPALVLANTIFGGGAQSKLFNNVREKLSLAYYAGSVLNRAKGFLTVNAGIETANFEKTRAEILFQLEEMKQGNISENEIESSKNFIINSLNGYDDDQYEMISYYHNEKIIGSCMEIEEYKNSILKLTKEDIVDAISKVTLDTVYFITGTEEAYGKDN
ncbi:MAG: insulinase family protein [Firmicutes bacterium]|nr:insulinase family protein [Bacillota bacterium]